MKTLYLIALLIIPVIFITWNLILNKKSDHKCVQRIEKIRKRYGIE